MISSGNRREKNSFIFISFYFCLCSRLDDYFHHHFISYYPYAFRQPTQKLYQFESWLHHKTRNENNKIGNDRQGIREIFCFTWNVIKISNVNRMANVQSFLAPPKKNSSPNDSTTSKLSVGLRNVRYHFAVFKIQSIFTLIKINVNI